jgi:zinc protease
MRPRFSFAPVSAALAFAMAAFSQTLPDGVQKVTSVAAFKEELNKALTQGFTAEEVEAVKKTGLEDNAVNMSQDAFIATWLGRYAQYGRTMSHLAEVRRQISSATADQVNAAFRKWIDLASFSYFNAGDFKKAGVAP